MGLDMFLDVRKYVSSYSESDVIDTFNKHFPDLGKFGEIKSFTFEGMYWRKANAIHNWFVQNVQGGEDDCGTYSVSIDQLKRLRATIDIVLNDPDRARELLSPVSGFFFGGTDIDGCYWDDLMRTHDRLTVLLDTLSNEKCWFDITYHSSW